MRLPGSVTLDKTTWLTAGFLNLWATEQFLTGHGLVLLKMSAFYKLNLQISWFSTFSVRPNMATQYNTMNPV